MPISVIKKDGSRELFNKDKLITGISRACEKTTFTSESIINFVYGIESKIRYASVYRKFNGLKDFISTLESLKATSKNELASIL